MALIAPRGFSKVQLSDKDFFDEPPVSTSVDYAWARRLVSIHNHAIIVQYNIACLSTMGGAYHLCNHPKSALAVARRQEAIGHHIGSSSIILRSMLHQYVNLTQLKRKLSRKMLQTAKTFAASQGADMEALCKATEDWVIANIHTI